MNEKQLLEKAVELVSKVRQISVEVAQSHIQRDDIIVATWLALISGRPAFFLGKPGVDKTGTIKAMARRITSLRFYDELMPLLATGADLIVESTSLKEEVASDGGKTISTQDTLGRAATADLFFADEIWKTPDPVLKTLFDLFNLDDLRHQGMRIKNPLLTFLAASNELPEPESQLEALWSRMTIRVQVGSLDRAGKTALVKARLNRYRTKARGEKKIHSTAAIALEEIKLLQRARTFVEVPENVVETVFEILEELLDDDSHDFQWAWEDDRRFGRLFDVMQANALLNGRVRVAKTDLAVLEWLLWDEPEQIAVVRAKLAPYTRTVVDEAQELVDALIAPGGTVQAVLEGDRTKGVQALTQCEEAGEELKRLKGEADTQQEAEIEALISQVDDVKKDVIAVVTGQR